MAKAQENKQTPPAAASAAPSPALAEATVEALPAKRAVTALIVSRWSEAQFVQARHSVRPEAGTAYEDLFDPAYFAHIASKFNVGDIVEVRPAEATYYAELYVWGRGVGWAQVSELRKIERPAASAAASSDKGFSIEFVEGPDKFRIMRVADRRVMAKAFESRETAAAWLSDNAGKIAA